jgi:hypothetical protein
MSEFLKILRQFALIILMIGALALVGAGVNAFFHFTDLVAFFTILRHYAMLYNFTWDMPLLFTLVGYSLAIDVLLWSLYGFKWVEKHFQDK